MQAAFCFRSPAEADGSALWHLARGAGLDPNSPYAYLMLCRFFSATCLLAEQEGEPVGFVTGFRLPERPDTLFVWQIGVSEQHRGQGLGLALLERLLAQEANREVRFLEATVTPGNAPSRRLFEGCARTLGAGCTVSECFAAEHFPAGSGHEAELLFRIGPIGSPITTAQQIGRDSGVGI